ncbi:MAG TPA: PBS lyase, partial [Cyanobacteria bacterium UBA11149]|nr:PBS lyase [Cyanobacteria bacterium UBA11149]
MLKLIYKIRKPLILFPLTLCLTLFLSLPWVSATLPPKPTPWQIDGIVAALDDSYPQVKEYAFDKLAEYEAQDLKAVLKKPEDIARKALNFLKDEKVEPVFLSFAIPGFVNLGEAGAKYAPQDWQIDGIVAAIDDSYLKVKSVAFWQLAQYDAQELKLVLKKPEDIALKAVNILSDEKVDPYIRRNAAFALGKLGEA